MNKSLRRRVAAVATTATVGGLLLPFLAAGSALAAEPTGITASPTTQTVPAGTAASITATLTGANLTPAYGVYYRITGGADKTTGNVGQACAKAPAAANAYTCTFTGASPTTDTFQIFYDLAGNGNAATANFVAADTVAATATVTFAGTPVASTIVANTANVSTNSGASVTVSATDVNTKPAAGTIAVRISQTAPTAGGDPLIFTDLTATAFPAVATGTSTKTTAAAVNPLDTIYTDTQTLPLVNGAATFGVASSFKGTVTVSGVGTTTFTPGTSATVTVSAGNTTAGPSIANDDKASPTPTQLALASVPQAFATKTVSSQVTVYNASGNPLGGVTVTGALTTSTGAVGGTASKNTGAVVTASGVTDQLGHTTLSYTPATAGADYLQAFVNQDTNAAGNTSGADVAEPQKFVPVTVTVQKAGLSLTSTYDKNTSVPSTVNNTTVLYTLVDGTGVAAAGITINFAIDPNSAPKASKYTLTPSSAVTNASGQVSVVVGNASPVAGDKIIVNASVAGDSSVNDNKVTLTYGAAAVATNFTLTPARQTLAAGSQVTESTTVVDQTGKPVSGEPVSFAVTSTRTIVPTKNATTDANGQASITYTDSGATVTAANSQDTVTLTVGSQTATAIVQFVTGSATTSTLTLAPAVKTVGITADPTAGQSAVVTTLTAQATDSNKNTLYNKAVTFTSSGVGSFTDSLGKPIGNTATANVDPQGNATVYVRSAAAGTEKVVASSDGVSSSTTTITYTDDYVAVTPDRVVNTRTGQGGVYGIAGGIAPAGPLAANTSSFFSYAATQMPLNAAAYVFNVTAINPSGLGNLRVAPAVNNGGGNGSAAPSTSIVNYQPGKDVANLVVVPNTGNSNVLQLFSAASSADVAIDLVGYYPTTAGIGTTDPVRVADTRDTGTPVTAGETRSFQIAGANGIPAASTATTPGTKAVALNVTTVNPKGLGNLRIFADGVPVPTTSNINYIPGQDKSATVIVDVPANGKISVYSAGSSADVAIDVYASFGPGSRTVTQTPVRVLDTRKSTSLATGGSTNVQIAGVAGVPLDAQAVLVSVTGVHTTGSTGIGNLRAYPAGGTLPDVSTLNYLSPTTDVANFAIVKIGANGQITLNTQGSPIDALVDVVGYVPAPLG